MAKKNPNRVGCKSSSQPGKKYVMKCYDDISDAIQAIEAYRDSEGKSWDCNDVQALRLLNKFWDEIRKLELFEEPPQSE